MEQTSAQNFHINHCSSTKRGRKAPLMSKLPVYRRCPSQTSSVQKKKSSFERNSPVGAVNGACNGKLLRHRTTHHSDDDDHLPKQALPCYTDVSFLLKGIVFMLFFSTAIAVMHCG